MPPADPDHWRHTLGLSWGLSWTRGAIALSVTRGAARFTAAFNLGVLAGRAGRGRVLAVVAGWGYDRPVPLRPWPKAYTTNRTAGLAWCGLFVEVNRLTRVDEYMAARAAGATGCADEA